MKRTRRKSDGPTPSERKRAEEFERHVSEAMPTVTRNRHPRYVAFDQDSLEISSQTKLTEHAIGCRSAVKGSPPPVMFQADGSDSGDLYSLYELVEFIDSVNLANWGYPDGCTAIHLPDGIFETPDSPPFVVHRGDVPSDGFSDVVFFSPNSRQTFGTAAASTTGTTAEIVVTYDRIAMCAIPPPYGRLVLRDAQYRERYSEMHIMAKFRHPLELNDLLRPSGSREGERQHPLENVMCERSAPFKERSKTPGDMAISPPGVSTSCEMSVLDFVVAAKRSGSTGIISMVISDPTVLLSQRRIAMRLMSEMRRWRAVNRPKEESPAAFPIPKGTVDMTRFISAVASRTPIGDAEGTLWNDKATARDVANLLRTGSEDAIMWAVWRMVSGSSVARYYSSNSDPISTADLHKEFGRDTRRNLQFVMFGKIESSLMKV